MGFRGKPCLLREVFALPFPKLPQFVEAAVGGRLQRRTAIRHTQNADQPIRRLIIRAGQLLRTGLAPRRAQVVAQSQPGVVIERFILGRVQVRPESVRSIDTGELEQINRQSRPADRRLSRGIRRSVVRGHIVRFILGVGFQRRAQLPQGQVACGLPQFLALGRRKARTGQQGLSLGVLGRSTSAATGSRQRGDGLRTQRPGERVEGCLQIAGPFAQLVGGRFRTSQFISQRGDRLQRRIPGFHFALSRAGQGGQLTLMSGETGESQIVLGAGLAHGVEVVVQLTVALLLRLFQKVVCHRPVRSGSGQQELFALTALVGSRREARQNREQGARIVGVRLFGVAHRRQKLRNADLRPEFQRGQIAQGQHFYVRRRRIERLQQRAGQANFLRRRSRLVDQGVPQRPGEIGVGCLARLFRQVLFFRCVKLGPHLDGFFRFRRGRFERRVVGDKFAKAVEQFRRSLELGIVRRRQGTRFWS